MMGMISNLCKKNGENGGKVRGSDELNNMKDKNEKYNKKSNRISQALSLPVLCNMNPRSVYNKQ